MWNKVLILSLSVLVVCAFAFMKSDGQGPKKSNRMEKVYNVPTEKTENTVSNRKFEYVSEPVVLEGSKMAGDISIGPEIPVTGLSGFYDYQFNGNQQHYIRRSSANLMHAIFMTNADSIGPYPSAPGRRTKYAASTDDGNTWTDLGEVPTNIRSGFCALTDKSDGTALIGNHYIESTLNGHISYDLAPGIGSFSGVQLPYFSAIWPLLERAADGNVIFLGVSYQNGAGTDTVIVSKYNTTTNTFGTVNHITYLNPPTEQNNSAMNVAANANGKVVILLDPYRETGGNWAGSRLFTITSTDNGATWGSAVQIFNPHLVLGDSATPNGNGACDIAVDNAGNTYSAWNSLGVTGFFSEARLYVIKNGDEPTLVAGSGNSPQHPIPQSVTTMAAQSFFSSFDHPSISLSDDGQYVFVSYSVTFQNDTLNGFNKAHIFYSYAKTSDMVWSNPIQVTDSGATSNDERYASINRVTPNQGGYYTIYMTYQKDRQPGNFCSANADHSFISRASLIFRKITDATLIGVNNNSTTAKEFKLNQNYPNPFNPTTTINYNVPSRSFVTLKIYNVNGQEVRTLVNGIQSAGNQQLVFDASNLPSGVYFYTITAGDFKDTKKMILVK
jgi:hypothetical protein